MVPSAFPALTEPKGVKSLPSRAASEADTAAYTGDAAKEAASSPPKRTFLLYLIVQPFRLEASVGLYCYGLMQSQTFQQISRLSNIVYRPKVRFCIRL